MTLLQYSLTDTIRYRLIAKTIQQPFKFGTELHLKNSDEKLFDDLHDILHDTLYMMIVCELLYKFTNTKSTTTFTYMCNVSFFRALFSDHAKSLEVKAC